MTYTFKRRQITQWLLAAGATAMAGACGPHAEPGEYDEAEQLLEQDLTYAVFETVVGQFRDIGVGAGGHVWAIGVDPQPGGYGIWRVRGPNWEKVPGGALRIAVDPQGGAWLVNDAGRIFSPHGDPWQVLPGLARDIAVGANGDVFVVGHDRGPDGFGIHKWDGRQWNWIGTNAVRIAVGRNGDPWVINNRNELFHQLRDGKWEQLDKGAIDVGIGSDDMPWIVSTETSKYGPPQGIFYYWNRVRRGPNNVFSGTGVWIDANASGIAISAGTDKRVWAVSPAHRPLRRIIR